MQAIEERGQVELVSGGKAYVMQLSPHALALIKKTTGLGFKGLLTAFQEMGEDPDFEIVGKVIWAATQDHHPELSETAAAGLFPAGGIEEIFELLTRMFSAAMPKSAEAAKTAENPPKAATKA